MVQAFEYNLKYALEVDAEKANKIYRQLKRGLILIVEANDRLANIASKHSEYYKNMYKELA
jgi:hypothetical protein